MNVTVPHVRAFNLNVSLKKILKRILSNREERDASKMYTFYYICNYDIIIIYMYYLLYLLYVLLIRARLLRMRILNSTMLLELSGGGGFTT